MLSSCVRTASGEVWDKGGAFPFFIPPPHGCRALTTTGTKYRDLLQADCFTLVGKEIIASSLSHRLETLNFWTPFRANQLAGVRLAVNTALRFTRLIT